MRACDQQPAIVGAKIERGIERVVTSAKMAPAVTSGLALPAGDQIDNFGRMFHQSPLSLAQG